MAKPSFSNSVCLESFLCEIMPATAGGHIKVRDYFDHCLAYPCLVPEIYFTPASFEAPHWGTIFGEIRAECIVKDVDWRNTICSSWRAQIGI